MGYGNGGLEAFPCPTRVESVGGKFADPMQVLPYSIMTSIRVVVPTAGTPVQVSINSIKVDMVLATVDDGNMGLLCVIGGQNVRATSGAMVGTPLIAANPPVPIYIDNLQKCWVDARSNNDAILLTYFIY